MQNRAFVFNAFYCAFFLFLFLSNNVDAQYYNYGQEPTRVKWSLIETDHYRVIFPESNQTQGINVAGLLDAVYPLAGKSLGHNHKKWDVILHAETATGLAYVAPAPSRSDWFLMEIQTSNCMDRVNLFTAHETRHMVQQSKIEAEIPKFFRYLLGEQITPIIIGAYLPFWFMEGDATCNETALGPTGSGRMPQFFMESKAQLVESEPFSFNKSYLGSYKNHTANAYQMGYLMVGGSRHMYQKEIWGDVVSRVAQKPLSITPFNKGIKQSIGISKYQLFDTIYTHYKSEWRTANDSLLLTSKRVLSQKNKYYSNYLFGTKLSNGSYFAGKMSLNELNSLVVIDPKGKEKRVFTSGYPFLESVSAMDSMVVWSEPKPHIRWEFRDKSMLRTMNLNTGKKHKLKDDKRYVAPRFSPDKQQLAVVDVDENYLFHLRILNAQSGVVEWTYSTLDNAYFITPSWDEKGQAIVCVLLNDNKQALVKIDVESKRVDTLLSYAHQNIISPKTKGDVVYFIGGYTGIDNVYSINTTTKQVFQETSVGFGAWNPSVISNELVYSNYTALGYELVSVNLDSLMHTPVNIGSLQVNYPIAETLKQQEGQCIDFENIKQDYTITKYSKIKHAFNFHSWGPFALSPVDGMVYPGVSVMSQNVMSTTEFQAGYLYNTQDRKGEVYANLKYKGLFPVLESTVAYGGKTSEYKELENNDTITKTANWDQLTVDFNVYTPLNLSRGKFNNYIEPNIGYQYANLSNIDAPEEIVGSEGIHLVKAGLYWYNKMLKSRQDIVPNFGMTFDLNYQKSLNEDPDNGYFASAENWLTLPGFAKSHGIKLYNGYQFKAQSNYTFSDVVPLARGYRTAYNNELYTFGVDYVFPFAYPDFTLLKTIYFKRFKAALFYDQSQLKYQYLQNNISPDYSEQLQSTGIELSADLHFFQIITPFDIGFRTSYRDDNTVVFDLLFGVSAEF